MTRAMLYTTAVFLAQASAAGAADQQYPVKPIRMVVGGSPDAVPRILGAKIAEHWGQQLVVDQRGGAGGTIAAEIVARAAPDGYTLLLCTSSHTMNVNFYKVAYDMMRDFTPVTSIAATGFVLAVHPSVPAHTVQELIALAKQKPGSLNFGSGGTGSPAHLIGEMFRMQTGVNMVHVPYKTVAEAVTDVIGGQTHTMFVVSTAAVPQITGGRIRGLGVTTLKRSPVVPDLPTLDEQGVKGFEATAWYSFIAPAATPAAIVERLHKEVVRDVALPDVASRFATLGLDPMVLPPDEFGRFMKAELAKWKAVAAAAKANASAR
ncbi:MAG TPA: tripartite tricarboxylate transporter substrate binding protein [Burkholderiales bacterium]|nr:tripartite tricarboxylate transporter substrate binding protein [Burkholderiales bacterium]